VERKVEETPEGEWIIGYGWDENLLEERRPPNRWDLDPVSPKNPVYLGRYISPLRRATARRTSYIQEQALGMMSLDTSSIRG
jgi:hypothetical protein